MKLWNWAMWSWAKITFGVARMIVGNPGPRPTGEGRICRVRDAIRWRVADLPGLDGSVRADGSVVVFRA